MTPFRKQRLERLQIRTRPGEVIVVMTDSRTGVHTVRCNGQPKVVSDAELEVLFAEGRSRPSDDWVHLIQISIEG